MYRCVLRIIVCAPSFFFQLGRDPTALEVQKYLVLTSVIGKFSYLYHEIQLVLDSYIYDRETQLF